MANFIAFITFLYFLAFLCYWIVSAITRKLKKDSLPRSFKFRIARYLFFASFFVFIASVAVDDAQKKETLAQINTEQVEEKPVVEIQEQEEESQKTENGIRNKSYDIEPMKKQLIAKKIDQTEIRLFILQDSSSFLHDNGIEDIESTDFIDCMNLNIFSNEFRKNGKTDLAPIREVCYKELKEGNPFKSAYRGIDPFNSFSMLGNIVNNVSNGKFEVVRTGMEKYKDGTIRILVVWDGKYKGESGEFGVKKIIKDFADLQGGFDIGDILSRMGDL
ncbi:hypothetical protein [Helicobacter sp.]|uniref:hypothetical protein n=1 Tax=Helicobacter sp. TaxID=218 RepID=UPI001983F9B0|nr:hypothetical protein [Helicobacter sp.]MBD5164592.1 hypothetical protein [Helicobacter sp.]